MRPVSRGNSRGSLEGHTTCRKTPIPWSTFDQNQTPGHLFEGKPVDEGTTRRGTDTPCIFRKNPQVPHTAPQVVCHLVNNSRSKRSSIPPHKTMPDSPVTTLGTLRTESEMERKRPLPGRSATLPKRIFPLPVSEFPFASKTEPPRRIYSKADS